MVKNLPADAGDMGLIPGSVKSPRGGTVNPLQCSYLEYPMDRGSLAGYSPQGHKRVRHNLATKQQHYVHQYICQSKCIVSFN